MRLTPKNRAAVPSLPKATLKIESCLPTGIRRSKRDGVTEPKHDGINSNICGCAGRADQFANYIAMRRSTLFSVVLAGGTQWHAIHSTVKLLGMEISNRMGDRELQWKSARAIACHHWRYQSNTFIPTFSFATFSRLCLPQRRNGGAKVATKRLRGARMVAPLVHAP